MATRAPIAPPSPGALPASMVDIPGYLVNRLAERFREATMARIASSGLRPRQVGLLLVLRAEGEAQQQQLGERLGMDRTTTMHLVTDLETQGVLVREASPVDRRVNLLRLTARGGRLADQVAAQSRAAAGEVLAPLTPAEAKQFHRLLVKLLTSVS